MTISIFDESERRKLAAWNKANLVAGFDPRVWRKDRFGLWMKFDQYGKRSQYGWEIDHVWPLSLGGLFGMDNEVATNWVANRIKSNKFIG